MKRPNNSYLKPKMSTWYVRKPMQLNFGRKLQPCMLAWLGWRGTKRTSDPQLLNKTWRLTMFAQGGTLFSRRRSCFVAGVIPHEQVFKLIHFFGD